MTRHLEYTVYFWSHYHASITDKTGVQCWTTWLVCSLHNKPRRKPPSWVECFKVLNRLANMSESELLIIDGALRKRNDGDELEGKQIK